ncbi:NAD(P)-binding protein [Pyrenochaeta sp. DS3sAY3a]|nr:NAD(P)-binding protein [Pyrenochaeta sp. DS3sAY3a]
MAVIAVAGGAGKLGRTIVEAILKQGKHQVVILSRQGSESKAKDIGAPVLGLDYSNVEAIRDVLQSNDIGTVISTLNTMGDAAPETALVKAADLSSTTKRFIPNSWGVKNTPEAAAIFPMTQSKVTVLKLLETTTLEYTTVINGFFLDYYTVPKIPSHMGIFPVVVDMVNNAAAIPGSGDVPVAFTHTTDVAHFVLSLLDLATWQLESTIVGEKLTWNEFVAIAEEVKGVKFDVQFDQLETLQNQQVTELPGHRDVYPFFPKQMLQPFVAIFGILFEKGFFDIDASAGESGVKARSVRELLTQAWK